MTQAKTLFEKIWDSHVVVNEPGSPSVLYIDLHLVHEVTSPQAFTDLRQKGLKMRRPDSTVATMEPPFRRHTAGMKARWGTLSGAIQETKWKVFPPSVVYAT